MNDTTNTTLTDDEIAAIRKQMGDYERARETYANALKGTVAAMHATWAIGDAQEEFPKHITALLAHADALAAENARLRAALEYVRDHNRYIVLDEQYIQVVETLQDEVREYKRQATAALGDAAPAGGAGSDGNGVAGDAAAGNDGNDGNGEA